MYRKEIKLLKKNLRHFYRLIDPYDEKRIFSYCISTPNIFQEFLWLLCKFLEELYNQYFLKKMLSSGEKSEITHFF